MCLQRHSNLVEVVDLRDQLVAVLVAFAIERAGLGRGVEHRVGIRGVPRVSDYAEATELKGDGAGLAQVAAVLGEGGAQRRRGTVAVVGQGLDDHGDAARPIAFVAHFSISGIVGLAAAAFDGTLDRILGHVRGARRRHRRAQARVLHGIGKARAGGHGQLADQLGEDLGALGVLRALAVHDVLELGVTGHAALFNVLNTTI